MEPTTILLMERNTETGYLEKEIGSYTVEENGELVNGIFLIKEDNKDIIHMKVTTEKDIEDENFDAVYDNYNREAFKECALSVEEVEDSYNPTWEITFEFIDNQDEFQNKLQEILNKHREVLDEAYKTIE